MYKKFFNLKGRPFGLNPEPKYFFNSNNLQQAFRCIGAGLEEGQGMIAISGGPGSGKTTLAYGLQHILAKTDVFIPYLHNPEVQSDALLHSIITAFGLPFQGSSQMLMLQNLQAFLENYHHKQQRIVFIVDEAQDLSPSAVEELQMLLSMLQGHKPVIQFVLIGQFALSHSNSNVLQGLLQKTGVSYFLSNMNKLETDAYIMHRMGVAGWKGDPEITAEAYTTIYDQTLGNPSEINMLCRRLLDAACCINSHTVDLNLVQWVIQEVVHEKMDVDFSGTGLELIVNKQYQKKTVSLEEDNIVNSQPLEERTYSVNYEVEDKSDAEKEDTIKNWLMRKKENSELSHQQTGQIPAIAIHAEVKDENEELLMALQSTHISKFFPEGTSEDDTEEIIY